MIKKRDVIFFAIVAIVGIILTLFVYLPKGSDGEYVEVRQNGSVLFRLPLNKDTEREIKYKEEQNVLKIKNGVATMTDANCKDQLCVHQSSISKVGQSIVCLPHKLTIVITGKKDSSQPDAIAS